MHTRMETGTGCHNSTKRGWDVQRPKELPGSISASSVQKKKRLGNSQMKEKKADMNFASKKKKTFQGKGKEALKIMVCLARPSVLI